MHFLQEGGEGGRGARRAEVAEQRAELSRLLEEYYKLDHEGVAGGIKTRCVCGSLAVDPTGLSTCGTVAGMS